MGDIIDFASFSEGEKIILELKNCKQIQEGVFVRNTKYSVHLDNVRERGEAPSNEGTYSIFYRNEIVWISAADQSSTVGKEDEVLANGCEKRKESSSGYDSDTPNLILLKKSEHERLQNMCKDYVYTSGTDKVYLNAVQHLLDCENIAIVGKFLCILFTRWFIDSYIVVFICVCNNSLKYYSCLSHFGLTSNDLSLRFRNVSFFILNGFGLLKTSCCCPENCSKYR